MIKYLYFVLLQILTRDSKGITEEQMKEFRNSFNFFDKVCNYYHFACIFINTQYQSTFLKRKLTKCYKLLYFLWAIDCDSQMEFVFFYCLLQLVVSVHPKPSRSLFFFPLQRSVRSALPEFLRGEIWKMVSWYSWCGGYEIHFHPSSLIVLGVYKLINSENWFQ